MIKILLSLILTASAQQQVGKVIEGTNLPGFSSYRNYIKNPSARTNTSGTAVSSAALTRITTSTNKVDNVASFSCDASSISGYCAFLTDTITDSDLVGNCEASLEYKGDATLYQMQVHDGTNLLASSAVLGNITSGFQKVSVNYPCGSTRQVRFTQTVAGTAPAVSLGRVYWGKATNLGSVNPIKDWVSFTPTGSWNTNVTYTGRWRQVGDSMEIEYAVTLSGAPNAASLSFNMVSGYTIDTTKQATTAGLQPAVSAAEIWDNSTTSLYSAQASQTSSSAFQLFYQSAVSGIQSPVNATAPFTFAASDVITFHARVPIVGWSSGTVYAPETIAWKVDANISGANPSLGTASVSSYTGIENGSLTLTNNTGNGNLTAQIPCSSTNAPTGTTCSVGNESVGVSFNLPAAGDVLACASFTHEATTGVGGSMSTAFQIVETPTNAQTISQEGKSRINNTISTSSIGIGTPFRVCGNFVFSSAGQKVLRLMYEQIVNTSATLSQVAGDASTSTGQRDIHWEVYPLNQPMPAPLLIGSISSLSTGLLRVESAHFNTTACTISNQTSSWISSVTNNGSSNCTIIPVAGTFSGNPFCNLNSLASNGFIGTFTTATPTPSVIRFEFRNTANVATATEGFITCIGPR